MNIEFEVGASPSSHGGEHRADFDLKEILTRLESRFDKLDSKIDRLEVKVDKVTEEISDVKTHLVKAEEEIKGEIKVLEARVDGISKRIDSQEFVSRGVIVGLILAILGGFAKIFGLAS